MKWPVRFTDGRAPKVYECGLEKGHPGQGHYDLLNDYSWPTATEPLETKYVLPGGATRSEKAPAFHLVPPYGARRTAQRFALGAEKHGVDNWKKSCEVGPRDARIFAEEAYNHMLQHALKMRNAEDPSDDHLGAIGWAVEVLAFIEAVYEKPWTEL
jgi:hypothetical protein